MERECGRPSWYYRSQKQRVVLFDGNSRYYETPGLSQFIHYSLFPVFDPCHIILNSDV